MDNPESVAVEFLNTTEIDPTKQLRYVDTVKKTEDPLIGRALTICLEEYDWEFKIEEQIKSEKLFGIEEAFPMLILAESSAQMSQEKIGETVEQIFQHEVSRWEKAAQQSMEYFQESGREFDKSNSEKQAKTALAYKTTLQRMIEEPGYGFKWFAEQRNKAIEEKLKLYEHATRIDEQLRSIFAPYREQAGWKSPSKNLSIVSDVEYLQINTAIFGRDLALKRSQKTDGFVTPSTAEDFGAIVLPVKFVFGETSYGDPSSGIAISSVNIGDKERLLHELTHFSPVNKTLKTGTDEKTIVRRGFTERILRDDSKDTNIEEGADSIPRQAIEEGTVVFIQKLIKGGSVENAIVMLNTPIETMEISRDYVAAAKITADLVGKIGVDSLLSSYSNSTLEAWLNKIEEKLGPQAKDEYIHEMAKLQQYMVVD
jgi:hypothetical protein